MRLLIKRALIIDPQSPRHLKRLDIFVKKGVITKIGRNLRVSADKIVQSGNLHVSPGWMDIGAQGGEPGLEHREDLRTLSAAAIAGGYSAVACFPNTKPAIHSKSEVEFIRNKSKSLPVDLYPVGAISTDCGGQDLAELYDMQAAGAIAFSDGRKPATHPGLMLRALLYVKGFNGLVINRPDEIQISPEGQIHESETSVRLGLKGVPAMREHVMLERDLRLLEYAESRLLVYGITTAEAIGMVKKSRRSGLNVSACTPATHLLFEDTDLEDFNTHLKIRPPLRESNDRRALIKALGDGTIDCIVSNHEPVEEERKKMEFAYADFGSTGLETAFAMAHTACAGQVPVETLVDALGTNPRTIMGLPVPLIAEGEEANITLFDPDVEWTVETEHLLSRSKNAAALGRTLQGAVLGVVCKQAIHLAPEK